MLALWFLFYGWGGTVLPGPAQLRVTAERLATAGLIAETLRMVDVTGGQVTLPAASRGTLRTVQVVNDAIATPDLVDEELD